MQTTRPWDYLIITAANEQQSRSYELQLRQRENAGEFQRVRNCLVVSDIEGRRIGSGGSTLHCLKQILERESSDEGVQSFEEAEAILGKLRILIVHAGGDSRRLPAYSHCGKMFVPVPDHGPDSVSTLFDRLIPVFLDLPENPGGQVVIASGDALILFDFSAVDLSRRGMTALGFWAPAEESANHGVFVTRDGVSATRYLQKPSKDEQLHAGAVNEARQSVLDLGVMSCDAAAAVQLMRTFFRESPDDPSGLAWNEKFVGILLDHGIDLYREICCALGSETSFVQYVQSLRAGGLDLEACITSEWFRSLHEIPLNVSILPDAKFLHFGTTRQLITSGIALLKEDTGKPGRTTLILNSVVQAEVKANHALIEACSVEAPLRLEGNNVVVGADIAHPLALSKGTCFDLCLGTNRDGGAVWFFRCYGIDDSFKLPVEDGATFCGKLLCQWLQDMGGAESDVWPSGISRERTLWHARVFPAFGEHQQFREWLWLFHPALATDEQKMRFWATDRYSSAEIALRVDQAYFQTRRDELRSRGEASMAHTSAPPARA